MVGYLLAIICYYRLSVTPHWKCAVMLPNQIVLLFSHICTVLGGKSPVTDHYFKLSVFSEFDCHNVISSSATCITCVIVYYSTSVYSIP